MSPTFTLSSAAALTVADVQCGQRGEKDRTRFHLFAPLSAGALKPFPVFRRLLLGHSDA